MTEDRSLERAARSWIEAGPTEAPERAVEAALLLIQTTPQERDWHVPWRTRPMTQTTRLLAGTAAVAIALLGGVFFLRVTDKSGVGGPSPTASPAPTGSQPVAASFPILDRTFTSNRYGFAVAYPSGWTIVGSTRSWTADAADTAGSGINEELRGTGVRFSGASQMLANGQTADAWIREFASPVGALAGQGGTPENWPRLSIGGAPGWIDVVAGVDPTGKVPGTLFDAVVVAGRYGYNFTMDGSVDRAMFEAFLATVTLPEIPALDQTFTSPLGGYSIDHPATWAVTVAPKAWTGGYETQSVSDQIGASPKIYGTSMKLPAGVSFDAWFTGYDADRVVGTACGAPSLNEDIVIDGAVGHLDVHCSATYLEAVVPKGGRVYVFTMFAPLSLNAPYSRPLLETLLASVHLTPATAKN